MYKSLTYSKRKKKAHCERPVITSTYIRSQGATACSNRIQNSILSILNSDRVVKKTTKIILNLGGKGSDVAQHYDSEGELMTKLTVTIWVLRHMTPGSVTSFQRYSLLLQYIRRVPLKRPYAPTAHRKTVIFVYYYTKFSLKKLQILIQDKNRNSVANGKQISCFDTEEICVEIF